MTTAASSPPAWQEAIYQVLKRGQIKQVGYVPDAGHAHVIRRVHADPEQIAIEDSSVTHRHATYLQQVIRARGE